MGLDLTGLGSVAELAKSLVNRFLPPTATEAEKLAAQVQMESMLAARENAVLDTQRAVMTAEMAQGDNYTKRARPTIVYFGLAAIGLVHVLLPVIAWVTLTATGKPLANMPTIQLPTDFWFTWGGVCSIWVIGRSAERRGSTNPVVKFVTGSK
jgi:hypothetical protein